MSGGDEEQEGWAVPTRAPLLALATTLLVLTLGLVLGGHAYLRDLAPRTRATITALPAPPLETIVSAPGERRRDAAEPPPPGIARAMARTVARGDRVWGEAR